jgi:hypothetical protein
MDGSEESGADGGADAVGADGAESDGKDGVPGLDMPAVPAEGVLTAEGV